MICKMFKRKSVFIRKILKKTSEEVVKSILCRNFTNFFVYKIIKEEKIIIIINMTKKVLITNSVILTSFYSTAYGQ